MNNKLIWAKTEPFQSLPTHARISGIVAETLMGEMLSDGVMGQLSDSLSLDQKQLIRFIGYLVSLHDIGKLEYSFQAQNEDTRQALVNEPHLRDLNIEPGVRHEKTGQDFLRAYWKENGENRTAAKLFSKVIGAHHQGKTGNGHYQPYSGWQAYRVALEEDLRKRFIGGSDRHLPEYDKTKQGTIGALLLGILILSDWIASGSIFADAENWIDEPDADERIRRKATEFLKKSGLDPQPVAWPEDFCGLWPNIPEDGKRPLQSEMERQLQSLDDLPLAILIEAPMGEGKTEAGLYAAAQMAKHWGKNGFYIAMPTAATANQMVGRAQALLDMHGLSSSVRLLHSMAWLEASVSPAVNSQDEHDEVGSWLAPLKRALLGQFAVGTVDQAMLAATNVKYGVLRLLGLANKVLIIDEIHSYDAYMNEIITRLLEWCRALRIPVVMLSATLPPEKKEKLLKPYTSQPMSGKYPLITMIGQDGTLRESVIPTISHRLNIAVRTSPILTEPIRIAEAAISEIQEGGCLCVLMNTVKEAQTVYAAIRARYDGDLLLFHAQFPAGRRAEIERECIRRYGKDKSRRPRQSILVATQVVEQSLDVDFDVMLTAIAPIDLLLQRMGRVFRHENSERPASHTCAAVTVLTPTERGNYGASAFVYPECLLNSTFRLLQGRTNIQIPEDLAPLVREGYDPSGAPDEEVAAWLKQFVREDVEAGASQNILLNQPDKLFSALDEGWLYDDEEDAFGLSAKTRLGEPTLRLALLPPEEMERLRPFMKTKNGQKLACVWDRELAERVMKQSVSVRIGRLGMIESDFWDIKGAILLAGTRIVPTDEKGEARLNNGKTLRFDQELGLIIKEGEL